MTYTSGVNGFVAVGNMLPTPPPMPEWAKEQVQCFIAELFLLFVCLSIVILYAFLLEMFITGIVVKRILCADTYVYRFWLIQ